MKSIRVEVIGLEALDSAAKELLNHIEAIRALQDKLGPYGGVTVSAKIESGDEP